MDGTDAVATSSLHVQVAGDCPFDKPRVKGYGVPT